MEKGQS